MKVKKLINSISLIFVLASMFVCGIFLTNTKQNNSFAAFTQYNQITNNLPQYLEFNENLVATENKSIILLDNASNQTFTLSIAANGTTISNTDGSKSKNYAYMPNKSNLKEYYLFNFTASLSLYKDITNTELASLSQDEKPTNLLQSNPISDFAHPNENGYTVEGLTKTPEKLEISFTLNSSLADTDTITLEEGLYTLVIPMTRYYTYDGGETYDTDSSNSVQIEYTFMVFNSSTYFNTTTGLQNITMQNVEDITIPNNVAYSKYYYYNYTTSDLPKFSYNPYVYQITVNFTDYNQITHYQKIEYNGNKTFTIKDENGNAVDKKYINVGYTENADDLKNAYITFNEIGSYTISFEYLYRIVDEETQTSKIFELPFEDLASTQTNLQYNKSQRLFVYGYQALYTNYNDPVDPSTNQLTTKELKTISDDKLSFSLSADITSKLTTTSIQQPSSSPILISNIEEAVLNYVKQNDPKNDPITTNQVPIKFISNVSLSSDSNAVSQIYTVSQDSETKKFALTKLEDFTNENQNKPGEYVYIIEYNFEDYMGEGGIQQSAYYHYQVFYFKVTNEVPAVTVVDENGESFAITRYTNKSVYIINESTDSPYNADVTINVEMKDYNNNLIETRDLQSLSAYDSTTFNYSNSFISENGSLSQHNGKEVVLINKEGLSANRTFTIKYSSTMTKENTYTFTIDTSEIKLLTPKRASETSNGQYSLYDDLKSLDNNSIFGTTNTSFAFQWNEKASQATTYAYVKYLPLTEFDYYKVTSNQSLINNLLMSGVLPVSYTLDLTSTNFSNWSPVANSKFLSTADATSVKTNAGLYLIEVYDIAGNVSFGLYMLDNTQPTFIKETIASLTSFEIVQSSSIVAVSENIDVTIKWGDYKAILLRNDDSDNFEDITAYDYAYMVDSTTANNKIQSLFNSFVQDSNSYIQSLNPLSGDTTRNGKYLVIEIDDEFAVKVPSKDTFSLANGNSYELELITDEDKANEATYQFLLRDGSNNNTVSTSYSNLTLDNLTNYPSSKLSVTISSDSSAVMIEQKVDKDYKTSKIAGFSLDGKIYKDSDGNIQKYKDDTFTEETGNAYKYAYFTPVSTSYPLRISYIPLAEDGSEIDTLIVKYYPYITKTESGYVAYYDVSSTPSNTITIYDSSKTGAIAGQTEYFELALGSSDLPTSGRYVITRTYKEGTIASNYDYYERIITIDVDPFDLISSLEPVSNTVSDGTKTKTESWYESLVGGEIVLSMYSGSNQSSIQVSFPFDKDGPKNDSFNNEDGTSNSIINTISVSGNKLPMMLYIPKYKFTQTASYNEDNNIYNVKENNNLSYYGNSHIEENKNSNGQVINYTVYVEDIPVSTFPTQEEALSYLENTSMTEYKTYAEISFKSVNASPTDPAVIYHTNGIEIGTNSGYLQFYDAQGSEVNAFYLPGTYTVTLWQAQNETGSTFKKFYKFAFEITSQEPEVDVVDNNSGLILSEIESNANTKTYYSNSSSLKFEWEIPVSEYLAQIDTNKISVVYTDSTGSNIVFNQKDDQHQTGNVYSIVETQGSSYFIINLAENLVTANGARLSVTMQYEGYNEAYYNPIILNIIFDTQAPDENLNSLINKFSNSTSNYLSISYIKENMRATYNYLGNSVYGDSYSYSYTPDSGMFKGFAYTVDSSYFDTLKNSVLNASIDRTKTQEVHYRYIGSSENYLDNYISATTKETFVSSAFTEIDKAFQQSDLDNAGVYEIVEIDSAGNMVTYLVNYINNYEEDSAFTFENNNLNEENKNISYSISNSQIKDKANIYSNTGLRATSLNYQNNPWAVYKIELNDGSIYWFMTSPNLQQDYVYRITKVTSNETTLNSSLLSQIFPSNLTSSSQKHSMTFGDSLNGKQIKVFVTIMDTNLIVTPIKNSESNTAVIEITVPTASQIASETLGHVYPTKIVIEQFNNEWQEIATAYQTEENYGTWDIDYNGLIQNNINFATNNTILRITISISANSKLKYTITDNFGNVSTIIQIANEASFNEIVGGDYVYTIAESGNATTYLADKTLTYSYNTKLYSANIEKWNGLNWIDTTENIDYKQSLDSNGILSATFTSTSKHYDLIYRIQLFDEENPTDVLKTVYIKLYNSLPEYNDNKNPSDQYYLQILDKNGEPLEQENYVLNNQTINFNGTQLTANALAFTTYSENTTLRFSNGQISNSNQDSIDHNSKLNYSVYISRDNGSTWELINDSYEGYAISGAGYYQILVKYDSNNYFTKSCKLFYLTILDSSTIYYHISVDGLPIEKSEVFYTNQNNKTFESTYIVAVNYNDKNARLRIDWNEDEELNLSHNDGQGYSVGDGVYVEEYSYNCTTSSGSFAIIYITPSSSFVSILNYEDSTGSSTQITGNSANIYASNAETSFEKLKINFKSYYGITENKIQVEVYKYTNGSYNKVETNIYKTNDEQSYIYLDLSGSYRLKFIDSCSPVNVHKFGNNEYLTITFLNEVPFTISYQIDSGEVDENGNPVLETYNGEKVQKAVYNQPITINLYNVSTYFQASGYPKITVLKNGEPLQISNPTASSYTFSDPGYYSIKFSATTLSGVQVRESEYNFTIINSQESRYAYSFANYKNYYVKQVIKDGIDITESLIAISNLDTVAINNKTYLSELLLSYGDEKTGSGRYTITISSNQENYASILKEDFTFDVWINSTTPPISVSIAEGESTSNPITVTINTQNFYNAIGDSYIVVGPNIYYINSETLPNYSEVQTFTLNAAGTWYIQVYTASGDLLYSYKVYKTEPLNAFSIIAIVIGIIVLIVIIIITIKLRKRQKVK